MPFFPHQQRTDRQMLDFSGGFGFFLIGTFWLQIGEQGYKHTSHATHVEERKYSP